jgi:hypothetical protein
MSRMISAHTALRAAQIACAVALAVLLWALLTASRLEVPEARSASPIASTPRNAASISVTDAEFARAVATDLFADDRAAPAVRYRIGATETKAAAFVAPIVVAPQLQLSGTVVAADGRSFAMCQLGAEPAKIVYVGQRIGTFTLRGVSQGNAVFTDESGKRVVLRVPNGG